VRLYSKFVQTSVAGLLVLGLSGSGAAQTTATAAVASSRVDTSHIRIDNFGRIDQAYYRGAQPEGRDYADLAALGVKTVINLTSDDAEPDESAMATTAGLKYFQIPMTTRVEPTAAELNKFLSIVNDPANQPVYVHCVGGRHRTGVMTAVYRMTNGGWSADKAFAEMKQYKYGADFLHPEFKKFVFAYHPEPRPATPAVIATQLGR
jgi:tyrosine-protein phosphatase SIW14